MKTTVEIGYGYALRSETGGEVTNAETGKTLETLEPNKQVHMTAQEPEWVVPDDCQVTKMRNFNHALAALSLLGGGADKLPAGYTRLEFLESTGTQWVTTGVIPTSRAGFRVRLSGPLTSGTGWGYLLGTQNVSGGTRFYLAHASSFMAGFGADVPSNVKKLETEWVEVNYRNSGKFNIGETSITLQPMNFEPLYEFLLFRMAYRANSPSDPTKPIRLFEFELSEDAGTVCKMVPAIAPTGEPCMYDLLNKTSAKNKGTGQFIAGFTLAQVRGLRLPAGGGKLTLALPHEASIDRLAQAALERARANGWELTLQYAEAEVPAGYRRLDYLESTGSQYIQIKKALTLADDCEFTYKAQNTGGEQWQHAFGTRVTANAKEFGVSYDTLGNRIRPCLGAGFTNITTDITAVHELKVSAQTGTAVLNGVSYKVTMAPISLNSVGVFCREGVGGSYFVGRIFEVSLFNDGEQFLQLVPALDPAGKPCMYDRVSGTAYQGVGTFAAGLATVADVRNLWLPATGGFITLSVPHDTPDSAVTQLRANYPNWQIAIQYRES